MAGRPVRDVTLRALVKPSILASIQTAGLFFFCDAPHCDVVYFNAEGALIRKSDMRVAVHQKDGSLNTPVCYCFGYTPDKIRGEIRQTGRSAAVADISRKVQEGLCDCETTNPQGTCCLGNIGKVVKSALAKFRETSKEETL